MPNYKVRYINRQTNEVKEEVRFAYNTLTLAYNLGADCNKTEILSCEIVD